MGISFEKLDGVESYNWTSNTNYRRIPPYLLYTINRRDILEVFEVDKISDDEAGEVERCLWSLSSTAKGQHLLRVWGTAVPDFAFTPSWKKDPSQGTSNAGIVPSVKENPRDRHSCSGGANEHYYPGVVWCGLCISSPAIIGHAPRFGLKLEVTFFLCWRFIMLNWLIISCD